MGLLGEGRGGTSFVHLLSHCKPPYCPPPFSFPFFLLSHLASPWQWNICVVMDSVMALLLPHLHSLLLNPAWGSGSFCVSFPNSDWINRLAVSESVTAAGSDRGQGGSSDLWPLCVTCWAWPMCVEPSKELDWIRRCVLNGSKLDLRGRSCSICEPITTQRTQRLCSGSYDFTSPNLIHAESGKIKA